MQPACQFLLGLWLVWRSVQGEHEQLQKFLSEMNGSGVAAHSTLGMAALQRLTLAGQSQNLYTT